MKKIVISQELLVGWILADAEIQYPGYEFSYDLDLDVYIWPNADSIRQEIQKVLDQRTPKVCFEIEFHFDFKNNSFCWKRT